MHWLQQTRLARWRSCHQNRAQKLLNICLFLTEAIGAAFGRICNNPHLYIERLIGMQAVGRCRATAADLKEIATRDDEFLHSPVKRIRADELNLDCPLGLQRYACGLSDPPTMWHS